MKQEADIEVVAVIVIASLVNEEARKIGLGTKMLEERYGATVYSIITDKDISDYLNKI